MDENNIEKAVVLALVSPEGFYYQVSNEHVLETTRDHRDRLLPFVDIDPRQSYVDTRETITERLKQYLDQGAVGVGEHKCGLPIDDQRNLEVFAAASDLELPVLFHIDSERNTDKPGLPGLEKALQAAPVCGAVLGEGVELPQLADRPTSTETFPPEAGTMP